MVLREAEVKLPGLLTSFLSVIILDLTIPGGMGGKETIKRIMKLDPDVKAIVSSGYSNDPIMSDYKSFGFIGVVIKPYQCEELGIAIQKAIKGNL